MKTAVVTASSKGIGFAVAERLLRDGHRVFLSSSNTDNLLNAYAKLDALFPGRVEQIVCNLRDRNNVTQLVESIQAKAGTVDILVNNCGGPQAGYYGEFTSEQWDEAFQEIFQTARQLTEAFLPGMQSRKWGRIVNITSVAIKQYIDNLILSTTMRSALTAYTILLSKQVAADGVTVNNVAPGYTFTERIEELAEKRAALAGVSVKEMLDNMVKNVPTGRFATVEEIASAVHFLTSEESGYITGNTLLVDGGLSRGVI